MNKNTKIQLNNGKEMNAFGLGVYLSKEGDECINAVNWALQEGYRLIDSAALYENEASVGQVVKESGIDRADIFVTTKLWNSDHGYDNTLRAFDQSMEQLNLDYVDLYLVHYPVEGKRLDTWKAMERIAEDGRCRSIGVSNYMSWHLNELLANCNIPPAVNQVEMHPYCFGAERKKTVELCREQKIIIQAYSPLVRAKKMDDPPLLSLAEKYGKTPAQILVRWALQEGFSVIPKSSKEHRIKENGEVFDFEITTEDMEQIRNLNENKIVCWDPTQTP